MTKLSAEDIKESAKAFLVGGAVLGGAKYVSEHIGPVWAVLVAGVPTGLLSAMFIKGDKAIRAYYWGYILQSIVLTCVIIVANVVLWKTNLSPNIVVATAMLAWLVISIIVLLMDARHQKPKSKKPGHEKSTSDKSTLSHQKSPSQ
jgi:hypothetical protein